MAAELITSKFRNQVAKQFLDSFNYANTTYYLFAAKSTPYGGFDDVSSLNLIDNQKTDIGTYKDILFGKRITNNDVAILATRHDWVSNTVYAAYSDSSDLFSTNFYSVVNESNTYYVYKCLNNNGGAPSTQQPTFADTSANDVYYSTSDNYQWKYMAKITPQTFAKFATASYIPLVVDANVASNAVPGAIETIRVDNGGSSYNNFFVGGVFNPSDLKINGVDTVYNVNSAASSVNGFYNGALLVITGGTGIGQYRLIEDYKVIGTSKLLTINVAFATSLDATSTYDISPTVQIVGDGNETELAEARAIINTAATNSVYKVEVLNRGRNYAYASASVLNSPTINVYNPAQVAAVIGPAGGHGADLYNELGGHAVGVGLSFANTESGTIPAYGAYREVGILMNPLFANVSLTVHASDGSLGSNGTFVPGETIIQDDTLATGVVSSESSANLFLSSAFNAFSVGNSTFGTIRGQTSNATATVNSISIGDITKGFSTFTNTFRYIGTGMTGAFTNNEILSTLDITQSNAVFYAQTVSNGVITIHTTENYGNGLNASQTLVGQNSGATMVISAKYSPDVVFNSGKILYTQGFNTINRSNTTTESIKIALTF